MKFWSSGSRRVTLSPLYMHLQVANFQRCECASSSSEEPEPEPSTSGVSKIAALRLLLLTILQLYHLPPPLPPPVSNSSCLFTRCQPLYASCCTVLLYFSRYCTVRLKMFYFLCFFFMYYLCEKYYRGFPGGTVVESLPANAGDTGSSPGLGGSHMPRSNWAHEPQLLSLRVWSLCSATREAATVRGPCTAMKWPPLATTRESPHTETKTQHSQR